MTSSSPGEGKGPLAHPPEPAYPCCLPALGELAGLTPCEGSAVQSSQPFGQPAPGWAGLTGLVPEVDEQAAAQFADPDAGLGPQPDADADDAFKVAGQHPGLEHRVADPLDR